MNTRQLAITWCQKKYGTKLKNTRASKLYKDKEASIKERCWWIEFNESATEKGEFQNLLLQKDFGGCDFYHLEIPNTFLKENKDNLGYREKVAKFSLIISAEPGSFMVEKRDGGNVDLSVIYEKMIYP